MFLFKRVFLILFVVAGFTMLAPPPPASAQSTELLLENSVCRDNPHSQDCICFEVRRFGYFPKAFDPTRLDPDSGEPMAKDADGDDISPQPVEGGLWEDHGTARRLTMMLLLARMTKAKACEEVGPPVRS